MPRTLTVGYSTAIAQLGTAPGWLIEILTTPILRYSTRGTLTHNGYTWLGGATISGVGESGLISDARMSLPNIDNAASALALTDLIRDVTVKIYAYDAALDAEFYLTLEDGGYLLTEAGDSLITE